MSKRDDQIKEYFPEWKGSRFVPEHYPQSDNPRGDGEPIGGGFGFSGGLLGPLVAIMVFIALLCLVVLMAGGAL